MKNYRAIPQGYMTVGEVAKKMNVTVRTLQHYDKVGLLSPSAVSDGGRRLYSDKDIVKLHQILSLKHLGFSFDDIRDRLIPLDAPADVAQILSKQASIIREKIADLTESLSAIEVLEMQSVDSQPIYFPKRLELPENCFPLPRDMLLWWKIHLPGITSGLCSLSSL